MLLVLALASGLVLATGCGRRGGEKSPGAGDDTAVVYSDDDGDGYTSDVDCDDADPDIHPDADERCDGINNDCDGGIDENDSVDATTYYRDADGDGYPDTDETLAACDRPPGYKEAGAGWDCDDGNPAVNPAAEEICNDGLDNDCDADTSECGITGSVALDEGLAWFWGVTAGDAAGSAIAGAGDVNGDGQGDVLVGAPGRDDAGDNAGTAYLLSGPLSGGASLATATASFGGASARHNAGSSLAGPGDVDGDGYDDVLIGAPYANGGGNDSGEAYLLLGPLSGSISLEDAHATLVGERAYDVAGASVAGALVAGGSGDLDGDGLPDLVLGATGVGDDDEQNRGGAYVISGAVSGTVDLSAAGAWVAGQQRYDRLGGSVLIADLDGDGQEDLVAGAATWSNNDSRGAVFVFTGPLSGGRDLALTEADARVEGVVEGDQLGSAVGAGDMDNDGYLDLIAGSATAEISVSEQGAARIFAGPLGATQTSDDAVALVPGAAARDAAGSAVHAGSDFNGDGAADLLVGAPGWDETDTDAGGAALFYGPLAGTVAFTDADLLLPGVDARDAAGSVLAFVGEVTGDAVDDLIVGVPGADPTGSGAGAAYLVAGQGW